MLIIGYLLGGPVGLGTVLLSIGLGYAMQFVFEILKYNPNATIHRGWNDEMKALKGLVKKQVKE